MLMLNILLSFAQFERELTRERTLSKMAGRAQRGLWNGGNIPIGFDYLRDVKQLRPAEDEAEIVRFIFSRLIETHHQARSRMRRTRSGSALNDAS